MKCQVLKQFTRRGETILPGSIIEVPDSALDQMGGYIRPLTHCQARKVGGNICGHLLKSHNGFLSCSDMGCQVPAIPQRLKRRGGRI